MTDEQFQLTLKRLDNMIAAIDRICLAWSKIAEDVRAFSTYELVQVLKEIAVAIFLCALAISVLAITRCASG